MATLSEHAMKNKKEYDKKYARTFFKSKCIAFNVKDPNDIALLEWVQKQENGNQYIKQLIREDMEKHQNV